jgi:hypothetical protein
MYIYINKKIHFIEEKDRTGQHNMLLYYSNLFDACKQLSRQQLDISVLGWRNSFELSIFSFHAILRLLRLLQKIFSRRGGPSH